MDINERVSVIIPTWNREKTIIRAINSVLKQTYENFEILICDDGSTDNTKDMILEMDDPRIRWIEGERSGRPAVPRNRGISNSSGEWIAFLDSDDEWIENKLEIQLKYAREKKTKAIASNALLISNSKQQRNYLDIDKNILTFDVLLDANLVICSSMLLHKSLFNDIEEMPEDPELKAIEDYALWLRVTSIEPIIFINEPLVKYLDDPLNSIRRDDVSYKEQKKRVILNYLKWSIRRKIISINILKALIKLIKNK